RRRVRGDAVIRDTLERPLRNLRLSVTDRCNLRCQYCMPEEEYVWLPREDVLSFEEMAQLVDVFADLGVDKVRLTGGEPLLRRACGAATAPGGCACPRPPRAGGPGPGPPRGCCPRSRRPASAPRGSRG